MIDACLGSSVVFLNVDYSKWTDVNSKENGSLAITTVLEKKSVKI
jgi:hypothetical protein